MDPVKPPKTRWIGAGAIIIIGVIATGYTIGGLTPRQVTIIGLTLDVLGAFGLVVPDIPRIHRQFVSGCVRNVMELLATRMGPTTIRSSHAESDLVAKPSDKSFYTFRNAIGRTRTKISPAVGQKWRDVEKIVKTEQPSPSSTGTIWLQGYDADGFVGLYEPVASVGYEHIMDVLEGECRRLEACIRRNGVLILITGFVLQMIAIV